MTPGATAVLAAVRAVLNTQLAWQGTATELLHALPAADGALALPGNARGARHRPSSGSWRGRTGQHAVINENGCSATVNLRAPASTRTGEQITGGAGHDEA